jgi:uncharacterized protein (DUF362 family)
MSKARPRDVKLTPIFSERSTFHSTSRPINESDIVDLVDKTELNTIVLDVKSEKGHVGWDSQVPLARIKAVRLGIDLTQVIKTCRAKRFTITHASLSRYAIGGIAPGARDSFYQRRGLF